MKNDFEKFKKKVMREHLIYSIIWAVCAGLVGAGVALMILIFTYKKAPAYAYPLIVTAASLVVAAVSFVLVYRLRKPSDTKIALRIDKSLGMNEKVATMIEFQDKNGIIIDKQREDASAKLSTKNVKSLPVKLHVWTLPLIVISGGLFAASFFTPSSNNPIVDFYHQKVVDPSVVDKETSEEIDKIKDNLDKINGSDNDFNQEIDKILDDLEKDLEGDDDVDSREDKIEDAKDKIDDALDKANNNDEIGDELSKSEDEALKELGEAIKNNDVDGIDAALSKLKDELKDLSGMALANKLQEIADEIREALQNSSIPEGDPTRDALNDIADSFEELAKQIEKEENDSSASQEDKDNASEQTKEDANKTLDENGDKIKEDAEEEKKNQEAADDAKKEMDNLKDPTDDSEKQDGENQDGENQDGDQSSGSQDGSEQGGSEQGGSEQGGTEQGGSEQGGSQQGGSQQGGTSQGSGQGGSTSGSGGNGTSGGSGSTKYTGNDKVYTEDGSKEYGDVIDESNRDANKDNDASGETDGGDDDISDLLKDYYQYLYGDGEQNP